MKVMEIPWNSGSFVVPDCDKLKVFFNQNVVSSSLKQLPGQNITEIETE